MFSVSNTFDLFVRPQSLILRLILARMPKSYNPDVDPDPERWLPRWERSTFKHKKQKRGQIGKVLDLNYKLFILVVNPVNVMKSISVLRLCNKCFIIQGFIIKNVSSSKNTSVLINVCNKCFIVQGVMEIFIFFLNFLSV